MWVDLWKSLLYTHPILGLWRSITSFVAILLSQKFLSYTCNDRKVMLPNFKAAGQIQAELHVLKMENWMCVYISHLLANPVKYCSINTGRMLKVINLVEFLLMTMPLLFSIYSIKILLCTFTFCLFSRWHIWENYLLCHL